jgi:hypothetical protein
VSIPNFVCVQETFMLQIAAMIVLPILIIIIIYLYRTIRTIYRGSETS